MKLFKLYTLGTLILAAFIYADHAVAISNAVQPTTFHLSPVAVEVPEDDDHEVPDEECERVFPSCEAHRDLG